MLPLTGRNAGVVYVKPDKVLYAQESLPGTIILFFGPAETSKAFVSGDIDWVLHTLKDG
jgi:hypothetical protein